MAHFNAAPWYRPKDFLEGTHEEFMISLRNTAVAEQLEERGVDVRELQLYGGELAVNLPELGVIELSKKEQASTDIPLVALKADKSVVRGESARDMDPIQKLAYRTRAASRINLLGDTGFEVTDAELCLSHLSTQLRSGFLRPEQILTGSVNIASDVQYTADPHSVNDNTLTLTTVQRPIVALTYNMPRVHVLPSLVETLVHVRHARTSEVAGVLNNPLHRKHEVLRNAIEAVHIAYEYQQALIDAKVWPFNTDAGLIPANTSRIEKRRQECATEDNPYPTDNGILLHALNRAGYVF